MDVVHSKGKVSRQAHVAIPGGTFEEEHGRETFFGRASHLYRTHPPPRGRGSRASCGRGLSTSTR